MQHYTSAEMKSSRIGVKVIKLLSSLFDSIKDLFPYKQCDKSNSNNFSKEDCK